jgi:hypothetical protein
MRRVGAIAAAVLVGAAIGAGVVGMLLDSREATPTPPRQRSSTDVDTTAEPRAASPSDSSPVRRDLAPSTSAAFDAELRRRGLEGIRRGWESQRQDPIPAPLLAKGEQKFEQIVADSPESIGRQLAESATKREKAKELGDAFELLEAMRQGEPPPPELVHDAEKFDALFQRSFAEVPIDGATGRSAVAKAIVDGATIRYPAGVFRVDELGRLGYTKDPPADLTIAGAGMDQTLLVFDRNNPVAHKFRDFTLRDCTALGDDEVLDSCADTSVTFDRVHVVGFDTGAGSSSALYLTANVLRARDCVFEGGYGRHPQDGELCDYRGDAMLARFERCRFVELGAQRLFDARGASIVFDGCRFTDLFTSSGSTPAAPSHSDGVEFVRCDFSWFDLSKGAEPPKKNLNDLFRDWERLAQR